MGQKKEIDTRLTTRSDARNLVVIGDNDLICDYCKQRVWSFYAYWPRQGNDCCFSDIAEVFNHCHQMRCCGCHRWTLVYCKQKRVLCADSSDYLIITAADEAAANRQRVIDKLAIEDKIIIL